MLIYLNKNVNPKERKTGDCSVRAIVSCTGIDYDTVMKDMFDIAMQTRYSMYSRETIEKVMNKYGWIKMKQPRRIDRSKFKVLLTLTSTTASNYTKVGTLNYKGVNYE